MPAIKRDLVEDLGIGPQVAKMAAEGMRPKSIIEKLSTDPDVRAALVKRGDVMLYPTDINLYLGKEIGRAQALLGATLEDSRGTALDIIAITKDRVGGALKTMALFEPVAERAIALLSNELDDYEEMKTLDPSNALFPTQQFDATRKAVQSIMLGLRSVRDDPQIQGIVRANTVNINQGVSQEDLHAIVMALGKKLGHEESVVSRAYTSVLMERRRGKRADAEDASFKVAPMAQAIEKRMGIAGAEG